jgi:hypothetical protein
MAERRLRLGMVGGGRGAFIGAVHRIASRIDDRWELVAGALSSDPDRARASAEDLGLAPDRAYSDFREMARAESSRPDGIDAVSIVTPNHMHAEPAVAFSRPASTSSATSPSPPPRPGPGHRPGRPVLARRFILTTTTPATP